MMWKATPSLIRSHQDSDRSNRQRSKTDKSSEEFKRLFVLVVCLLLFEEFQRLRSIRDGALRRLIEAGGGTVTIDK